MADNFFKIRKGLIVNGSGSTILDIQGSQGQLFSVTDNLQGSLFAVNDISGIPIMEVFSDDTVKLGTFNDEAIIVDGNTATINNLDVTGNLNGDGSSLTNVDADTLDGQQLTSVRQKVFSTAINNGQDLNSLSDGWYNWTNSLPSNAPFSYAVLLQASDASQKNQLAFGSSGTGKLAVRRADSGTFYDWANFWNEDNDGAGSGLDADLLDGQQGSYYRNASNLNAGTINDTRLPDTISSDITGNAATATKWATARTITLGGDLSGNVSIDGSSDVTLNAQVANNSHNHDDRYYTETESESRYLTRIPIGSSLDVNDANGTQLFIGSTSGWTNRGPSGNNAGALFSINTHPGDYYSQFWFDTAGGSFYHRTANNILPTGTWRKVWDAGNDGADSGLDADLLDGQQGSYYLDYNNFNNTPSIPTVNDNTITIEGGDNLIGSGSFDLNQSSNQTITINHADTSTQSSSTNSGRTYIQSIGLDSNGHVTSLSTASEAVTNTNDIDYVSNVTLSGNILEFTGEGNAFEGEVDLSSFLDDTNTFLDGLSFNNGILTASLSNNTTESVDLDGRYLTSESDTLQDVTDRGDTTTNNIGIGTTNTSEALNISGKININDGGNSVFVGEGAGLNDGASNNQNVGVGYDALRNNTTGNFNTAIGYRALRDNTTGDVNTATGLEALRDNTTGIYNTANGTGALEHNTTGSYNTAIGHFAGSTTGNFNINQTGNESLFLGNETTANADGQTNQIVIGYNATGLGSNTVVLGNSNIVTTALRGNVGIGTTSPSEKLSIVGKISITDGGNSVFIGEGAGLAENPANVNNGVGVGHDALRNNTAGPGNTAIGNFTLLNNTSGGENTAIGANTFEYNTTGTSNTAIGSGAGNVTSNFNLNQTGNNSVFLGSDTKANADGQTNQIVIGYNATGLGSNTVVLGNSDIETTALRGNVGIGTTSPNQPLTVQGNDPNGISIFASNDIVAFSDESVKENIRPIENVVQRITQSRGVLYDRKDSKNKDNIGFIAQELEQQFPELVTTNKDGTKSVKYQNATAVLFEAVKQQQQQLDKHEAQIQELKKLITDGSTK